MVRCEAPDHPDCWNECDEGPCIAFYEPETQLCIRGCNGYLFGLGFMHAIGRQGWNVQTTAQAIGIRGEAISLAASVINVMAHTPEWPAIFEGSPSDAILELTDEIRNVVRDHRLSKEQVDVTWPLSQLENSLKSILAGLTDRTLTA